MHIVAAKPLFLSRELVSSEAIESERDILKSQVSPQSVFTFKHKGLWQYHCALSGLHLPRWSFILWWCVWDPLWSPYHLPMALCSILLFSGNPCSSVISFSICCSCQAESSGKSQMAVEKMVEGRLRKYFEEVVLMEQKFVVNDSLTIKVLWHPLPSLFVFPAPSMISVSYFLPALLLLAYLYHTWSSYLDRRSSNACSQYWAICQRRWVRTSR